MVLISLIIIKIDQSRFGSVFAMLMPTFLARLSIVVCLLNSSSDSSICSLALSSIDEVKSVKVMAHLTKKESLKVLSLLVLSSPYIS